MEKKSVDQNQQVKIDFLGAVSEMEKLDYKFEKNFIGFQNCSSGEYVQFVRLGNDSWYADAPIKGPTKLGWILVGRIRRYKINY